MMTKLGLLGSSALRSLAFAGVALSVSSPLLAQEVATEQDPSQTLRSEPEIESGEAATDDQSIIVTGSRIRRPNLESTIPITSIGGEEFFETGQTSVGDVLNELPALRSTFSQSNSSRFLGTAGLNLLDLRGLGTVRTLVLQNGRRHVPSDILNNTASTDVNTIPTDLIERVDVVTGGNSAIYGSDAIAGVVNFILKKDYEGLQVRGQGGVSKYGDAGSYYVSALGGTNFADGRGNIALNVEYAHQEDFYASGRPNLRINSNFVIVDADAAGSPNGSDGTPDRLFFNDIRSATYTDSGTVFSCCDTTSVPGQTFLVPYIFQPDGTLAQQTGQRVGRGPFGSFIGGNGDNFRSGTQLGLSPKLDRYSANLIAHFNVSDAFEPFVEAKYTRTDSLGNASGPYFTGATGSPREVFRSRSNPYLTDQARDIIEGYYGDYYTDYNGNSVRDAGEYTGGNGVTDAEEFGFSILRNVVELGNREEKARRQTYRIVAGVRGDFNDDWSYEVSANYGRFTENTAINGNVNLQRYLLATDAVRDPGTGNIVCRAQIDPAARLIYEGAVDNAFAQAQLANDVATCVPVNLFGAGNITPEARRYLLVDSEARGRITQFVLNAFMSGDLSQLFELPGGPVGFALGAEYRRENVFYDQDEFTQSGLSFYNAISTFDPDAFEVKEAFGEIRIPLLKDMPFFNELTVSAAGRVSDYKGSTGTTFAYNAGVDWAPVRDIRFRANYSRAVRAPNLTDSSFPLSQNFSLVDDPCSDRNLATGSENRAANCAAAGRPADYDFVYDSSLGFLSGGNPDLKEETSDSYTIGGVIQPRFLPGFALSVDYYDITVNDVIQSVAAQTILDTCYDAASLENQFCALFERAGPGGGPRGEVEFQILENSLQVVPLNFAKLKVRGLDVEASYRHTFSGIGNFSTRLNYTRVFQNDAFTDPTDPGRADRALYELGDPRDAFNWDVDLKTGPFTIGYQMRYIGKMVLNEYEDFFSVQGRPPENADYADRRFYPDVFYHDARLSIDATNRLNFYIGVDNIGNRNPPLGLTGAGGGSGIYTNRGRFFYAGAVAKF